MTLRKISSLLLLLGVCLSGQAFGQAARFDSVAQTTTTVSATNTTVLVPLPGATITVLNYPANGIPGTNKASICPDVTLVGCTTGAPNNPITADSLGNFGFWAMGGSYDYTVCAVSGVCQGPYHAVLGQPNGTNSAYTVDGISYTTIQAAINAAGTTGYVIIPSSYAGIDTYTNTNGIQINDRRRTPANAPSRYRGFINMLTDCGLKGDGTTDDAVAANACFAQYPGQWFVFPKTQPTGTCSYFVGATLFPKGEGALVTGAGGGFRNSNTHQGGTEICSAAGVTPLWLDMTPNSSSGITIENLSLKGSEGTDQLTTPTKLNIPSGANLPQFTRTIATIQRTSNVLTVTTALIRNEGLTLQVGSQVLISGVVGDATMNGRCIVATLTGTNTFGENATGFTCAQNGADAGPFGAVGTVSLPTTGASTADGIRVCSNFDTIRNVSIDGFGRHGINADMQAGHGCTTNFADDLLLENVVMKGNQGDGFYCQGVDCNAGTMFANPIYYNLLWGVEDQSSLGNNWFGNQISNNGSQWASASTPTTKVVSTIARTLTSGQSQVSVVLSVADTNLKLGSCIVIAGVTDTSFNTATPPAGTATQAFFINSYTDSTHFGYEQPGAPANASSSGGTSRMGKFSECYLSAGVDSGAVKVATQTSTYSQPWIGNYVEGGQVCKWGVIISIGGANNPDCATQNTWRNAVTIRNVTPGTVASSSNIHGFANEVDGGNNINFKAGLSGGTVRDTLFNWYNNNDSSVAWILDVNPTGNLGVSGQWVLKSPFGVTRFSAQGTSLGAGLSRVNSESTGAVEFNNCNNCGSGGIKIGSGGVTNSTVATIDSTGLGTFVGIKSSGAISPTVAGAQTAGTNPLPFSSIFVGAAATNNAQLTGTFTGARVQTLPDVTGTVSMIDAKLCGTTSTCANTTQTLPRIIFGSVALASATPSAVTVSGISPAFTSTSSYFCTATPVGATAAIAAGGIAVTNVSSSSFTLTGPNTVTTVIDYTCVGN